MKAIQQYKLLLFDIGNVVIDIDYQHTLTAFNQLSGKDLSGIVTLQQQTAIFDEYERGEITTDNFLAYLKERLQNNAINIEQIIAAWNALLVNFPQERFALLSKLKKQCTIAALSNINELHLNYIDNTIKEKFGTPALSHYFDYAFYSHEMGMRKPEPRIYKAVLAHYAILPEEVLLMDDKKENLEAAAALGIDTILITPKNQIIDIFAA